MATTTPTAEPPAPCSDQNRDCRAQEVGTLPPTSGTRSECCWDTALGAKATGEGSVFGACPWIRLLHFQIGRNLQIVLMLQIGYLSLYAPHHIPWAEINHHTQIVTTKVVLSRMLSTKPGNLDKRLAESTWQCPPCDEDWDKDLWKQTSTPFLWGTAI